MARELWKSDGTVGGTRLVRNINPTPGAGSYPTYLTDFNGTLFFSANDGTRGLELWKSDGTNAGTTIVSDIVPGIADSVPANLTPIPGSPTPRMIFTARFFGSGTTQIVYSTDGNTVAPVDFTPGVTDDKFLFVDPLAVPFGKTTMMLPIIGNSVLVAGNDFATGDIGADQDLWITDGTGAGSSRVVNLPNNSLIRELTSVTNGAFFTLAEPRDRQRRPLEDQTARQEAPASSATSSPPDRLTSPTPLSVQEAVSSTSFTNPVRTRSNSGPQTPRRRYVRFSTFGRVRPSPTVATPLRARLSANNGTLYFTNIDSANGMELWKSNGTPGGTVLVKDVLAGPASSTPRNLTTSMARCCSPREARVTPLSSGDLTAARPEQPRS